MSDKPKSDKPRILSISRAPAPSAVQKGIAFVLVIVVLLTMTLLALSTTDSGTIQQLMARNSQFRLEAFNASSTEIQAQLDHYDDVGLNASPVIKAIDSGDRMRSGSTESSTYLAIKAINDNFEKQVELEHKGDCVVYGNTLNIYKCNLMIIDSDANLVDSEINSDQAQTFSILTYE